MYVSICVLYDNNYFRLIEIKNVTISCHTSQLLLSFYLYIIYICMYIQKYVICIIYLQYFKNGKYISLLVLQTIQHDRNCH